MCQRDKGTRFGDCNSRAIFAAWKIVIKTKTSSPSVGLIAKTTRPSSSLMAQAQSLTAITFFPAICSYRLAFLQPAARASSSVQNQRSPYSGLIFVSQ